MTSETPSRSAYGTFLERRLELAAMDITPEARDEQIKTDVMLGIGLLIGAGYPGAASAVSLLLGQRFPHEPWPWSPQ